MMGASSASPAKDIPEITRHGMIIHANHEYAFWPEIITLTSKTSSLLQLKIIQ
uniref:Uncharacterized protein n=1 Tax=Kalanchoe fedtschenkoi TaxID=63787 RepID=A0A7N0V014_KALFE